MSWRLLASCLALAGCSLDASGKQKCVVTGDCLDGLICRAGECGLAVDWRCLANAPAPPQAVPLSLVVADESTDAPIAGAVVRVCTRTDVACSNPIRSGTTDALGRADLDITDEFVELEAAGYRRTLVSGVRSFELAADAAATPGRVPVGFDLYADAVFTSLVEASQVQVAPGLGHIHARALDCNLENAPGVHFELDREEAETAVRYLANDLPSVTAGVTDLESGSALIFNVAAGVRTVAGNIVELARTIGPAEPVITREGWLTDATLVPQSVPYRPADP